MASRFEELHVVLSDGVSTKMLGAYPNRSELEQALEFYKLRYSASAEFLIKD